MIRRLSRSRRRSLIYGRRGRRGCLLLRGGRLVRVRQERDVRVAPGHQSWYVWLSVTIVDKSHGQERRTYPRCRNRPLPIGPQLCWSDLWRNDILWFSGALEQFPLLLSISIQPFTLLYYSRHLYVQCRQPHSRRRLRVPFRKSVFQPRTIYFSASSHYIITIYIYIYLSAEYDLTTISAKSFLS